MAGIKGNIAYWAFAKQTAKGSPAANALYLNAFSGGNIAPARHTGVLAETDASRDEGVTYVSSEDISGNPDAYVRDAWIHAIVTAALGAQVDTGASPNFVHTSTPASALSYYTFWKMQGDLLWEQYNDCMVSDLNFRCAAGQPMSVTSTILGRSATRLTSDPAPGWTGVTIQNGPVYTFNDSTITLSGSPTTLVDNFDLTITNGVTLQQTNAVNPYDVVPGKRTVTLTFDLIFENLNEYNLFHYGSTSGTAETSSIYTTSFDFKVAHGTNNSIDFSVPILAYEDFPVQPEVSGAPVKCSIRAQAQRPNPVVTIVTKNQIAT